MQGVNDMTKLTSTYQALPEKYIATATYQEEFGEVVVDFQVTFTAFGEVLAVDCPLLSLPQPAQQMMLGPDHAAQLEKLRGSVERFRFVLPLAAFGIIGQKAWNPINTQMEVLQSQKGFKRRAFKKCIEDEWVLTCWQLHRRRKAALQMIRTLYFGDTVLKKKALASIHPRFAGCTMEMLFNLLQLEDDPVFIREIYLFLGKLNEPAVTERLLEDLADDQLLDRHKGIITSLRQRKNERVRNALVNYYYKYPRHNLEILETLLDTLKFYRRDDIRKVFLREATGVNHTLSKKIFIGLSYQKISEKEISQKLTAVVIQRESTAQVMMALKLFLNLEWKNHCPQIETLLEVLLWSEEQKNRRIIEPCLLKLFDYRELNQELLEKLVTQLDNPDAGKRWLAVLRLGYAAQEKQFDLLLHLTEDADPRIRKQVYWSLGNLMRRTVRYSMIEKLQHKVENTKSPELKENLVRLMVPGLKHFRRRHHRVFLENLLKKDSPGLRLEALRGLGTFRDKAAKEVIEKFKNDQDHRIKVLANQLVSSWYKQQRGKLKKQSESIPVLGFIVVLIIFFFLREC